LELEPFNAIGKSLDVEVDQQARFDARQFWGQSFRLPLQPIRAV
jgi:hypothetical protein